MKKMFMYAFAAMLVLAPVAVSAQWASSGSALTTGSGLQSNSVASILTTILNWLLYLLTAIAVIGFVVSGILYITAAGDEGKVEKAKNFMTYSIIGIIVALIGLVVVRTISNIIATSGSSAI